MLKVNETRTSPSIPRRLLAEGKVHLLPLYVLLRTSDLAREGMEHSGSFRFADHLYRREASGRFLVGLLVDAVLLALPSSRSFRSRFLHAREEIVRAVLDRGPTGPVRVLSVPCGIPREMVEAARRIRSVAPELFARTTFHCLDLDPDAIVAARALAGKEGLSNFDFATGDAFDPSTYPASLDVISTTGFAEFLSDEQWVSFYSICHDRLVPGGSLITASTVRHRLSSYLMEELAELQACYREEDDLERLFALTPFRAARWTRDGEGYQILISAAREYNQGTP